ncbi:hypothetical protein CLG96_10935 [Sphingomonas oleivorans]|uniref:Uncharacterized protein n=1 Tax=Sphingomonas oleivorans TaxID=1735121 RepID=A0A2T5FXM9_9SPHN|nr:hypothetical protein CLG96_10935 [Sphingomonas oleivorans]
MPLIFLALPGCRVVDRLTQDIADYRLHALLLGLGAGLSVLLAAIALAALFDKGRTGAGRRQALLLAIIGAALFVLIESVVFLGRPVGDAGEIRASETRGS